MLEPYARKLARTVLRELSGGDAARLPGDTINMNDKILKSIENELVELNFRWKILCQLYESGEKNIVLLNNSGSNVFYLLQKLIINETIISLCRITDTATLGKNQNASIYKYISGIELNEPKTSEIKILLRDLQVAMKNMRKTRNKILVHADISYSTKISLLPRITYDEIEKSISILVEILNLLSDCDGNYVPRIPSGHDGRRLLKLLAIAHNKGVDK